MVFNNHLFLPEQCLMKLELNSHGYPITAGVLSLDAKTWEENERLYSGLSLSETWEM